MDSKEKIVDRYKASNFTLEAMSNLRSRTTGVEGAIIWISAGEFAGVDAQHGPRIKVVLGDRVTADGLKESISVRLTDPPIVLGVLPGKIKRQVIQFIDRNRETLIRHWNGELDAKEAIDLLERV